MKDLLALLEGKDLPAEAREAHWCVKTLAQRLDTTPRELERYFKLCLGECPHAWMLRKRLATAPEVLAEQSIKIAAGIFGYNTRWHFTREFKKVFGESPARYMERLRSP